MARNPDVRRPQQRQCREHHDDGSCAERDARPELHQKPTGSERASNAHYLGNGLTHAYLLTAMLIVPEGGEIGVVARPVERLSHGRDDAKPDQRPSHAADFGKEGILHGRQQRTGDDHCPQPPSHGETDDERANEKAPQQDKGERDKHHRHWNAGFQKVDGKECSTAAERDGMNSIMQVEKVDGVVAKEGHGDVENPDPGFRVRLRSYAAPRSDADQDDPLVPQHWAQLSPLGEAVELLRVFDQDAMPRRLLGCPHGEQVEQQGVVR